MYNFECYKELGFDNLVDITSDESFKFSIINSFQYIETSDIQRLDNI
jgi:hypothetical protein